MRLTCDDVDALLGTEIQGCCGGCHCPLEPGEEPRQEKAFEVDGVKVAVSYCCSKEKFVTERITEDQIRTMMEAKCAEPS